MYIKERIEMHKSMDKCTYIIRSEWQLHSNLDLSYVHIHVHKNMFLVFLNDLNKVDRSSALAELQLKQCKLSLMCE